MEYAILVPVGPHPLERSRLEDLLMSLSYYERFGPIHVVIIDDVRPGRGLVSQLRLPSHLVVHELENPRGSLGSGWGGGLAAGVAHGMRWIVENTRSEFIVRLDTDALVIGGFSDRIAAAFARMPTVGMVGSNTRTCREVRQRPSEQPIAKIQAKLLKPLAFWIRRQPWRGIQLSCVGRWRKMRRALSLAMAGGYQLGDFVHGGGYAIRREAIESALRLGLLDDPLTWIETSVGEDVAMSVYVWASGYRFADLVDDGDPFAVQAVGIPDDPERLIERGFAIVHSLKGDSRMSESDIRKVFAARRVDS